MSKWLKISINKLTTGRHNEKKLLAVLLTLETSVLIMGCGKDDPKEGWGHTSSR